jgi:acyl-CoA synthetase (NDP forming)
VIVISSGFKETSEAGKELERQMLAEAHKAGIRIIGPNCQGVNSTTSGLCASWPLVTTKGAISIVSQSGTVGAALECWAADESVGVCKFVALGNKSDVDEIELLEYLADDPSTRVIALYIEGVRDGRKFMEVARDAVRRKPVVVLKGGRTVKGAEAVLSHTRSLAGSDKIFDAAFKQVGIIRAGGVEELYDMCKGFARLPLPKGKNVVVITSSGGAGILATDASEEMDLDLVNLPDKALSTLKEKLPPECILRNPLDLTGSATSQMYDEVLAALGAEPEVHSVVMIIGDPMPGITEVILKHFKAGKTIVPVMLGGGSVEVEERAKLQRANVPVYSDPTRAVRALAALIRH